MSVRKCRRIGLNPDEVLFLIGSTGELGIAKAGRNIEIFIGTEDDEIVMFLDANDLIAVSAFDVGNEAEKAIRYLIYLLREWGTPIIVLPENHPTSNRLKMVVSCGDHVRLDCDIQPGTHPEQDILCACQELSGVEISAFEGGVEIKGEVKSFKVEKIQI